MGQFGVSQPVLRREDQRLITGQGRFVDDVVPDGRAYGFVLRSPYGHARIRSIDVSAAETSPGVLAVMTGADDLGALPCLSVPVMKEGTSFVRHDQPVLVGDRARYVGDPVAFVVAETLAQARDAAESIEVDYDALPAAVGCGDAAQPGAAPVWDDAPANTSFIHEMGDKAATDTAFAAAAHVVALDLVNNRIVQNAIEPRSAIGVFDPASGRFTLTTGTQMPNAMKTALAEVFGLDADRFRVLVDDVGGGFGGKNSLFPEQVLVLEASRRLGSAGDLAERTVGSLHQRLSRPGQCHARRIGVRRRRPDAGDPRPHLRRPRRLHGGARPRLADQRPGDDVRHLPAAGNACGGAWRLHEHRADRSLSRRGPAGSDLHAGTAGRSGGHRAWHRPDRA